MSTDAVAQHITVNAQKAAVLYPAIARRHITPHTLRHTCAMRMLQSGVGIATIALWLGPQSIETTQIYLHKDLSMKERALAGIDPIGNHPTRFQSDDELLSFLEEL